MTEKKHPDTDKVKEKVTDKSIKEFSEISSHVLSIYGSLLHSPSLSSTSNIREYLKESTSESYVDKLKKLNNVQENIAKLNKFEQDLIEIKTQHTKTLKELLEEKKESSTRREIIQKLQLEKRAIEEKYKLKNILHRVNDEAQKKLMESAEFIKLFTKQSTHAYVMSIDIRKSTDLMLKARSPELFAEFITTLASELRSIIINNYGIYDKFTGDGVLAYFPDFFTGTDFGYLCLDAANKCHETFMEVYRSHRRCFTTVNLGTGLGIGIDYGSISLQNIGDELVIVGTPVVYACRMSSAKAGTTLLNQQAYELLFEMYSAYADFDETELEIKNEGITAAYSAKLNEKKYAPSKPTWLT